MIRKARQPETWVAPDWHPDFGDAKAELDHLRAFAVALLAAIPDANVELELPEPGLMNLAVDLPNGTSAEIYSVSNDRPDGRRYGIFLEPGTDGECEIYQVAIDDAVASVVGSD